MVTGSQTRRQPPLHSPRDLPKSQMEPCHRPRPSFRSSLLPVSPGARPSPRFQLCQRAMLSLAARPLHPLFPYSWDAVPFPFPS